ncbi:MAG: winged helix-turn-helix transcriptional regulator [Candidatus Firestonebacteria bacterium]|nr:winged helix-turn-helix transcriptional regulator [Candidatus Firestonebacteria bacterium]
MRESMRLQALFHTLSDANRLGILKFIGTQSRSVSDVVAGVKLSQPLVSHHLKVLREHKLLKTRREGVFVFYELNDPRILEALGVFAEIAAEVQCCGKTARMFCCPDWFQGLAKTKRPAGRLVVKPVQGE